MRRMARKRTSPTSRRMTTAVDRLDFLLDFAQRPALGAHSERHRRELSANVYAFCISQLGSMRRSGSLNAVHSAIEESATLDASELDELAITIRDQIEGLKAGRTWQLRADDLPEFTRVLTPIRGGGRLVAQYVGPIRACFLWAAADVVQAEYQRIQKCAWAPCRRLFVKKKRGLFCSLPHRQHEHNRRFRTNATPEHLSDLRRRAYVRKIARELKVSEDDAAKMARRRERTAVAD